MKPTVQLLLGLSSLMSADAQGWGQREAMDPWLRGRFQEADQQFHKMIALSNTSLSPDGMLLAWDAEFEIERGRYAVAAKLLKDAKSFVAGDAAQRRQARLLCTAGQFAEAEKIALTGVKWDGLNIDKLKIEWPMVLNTIGEVFLTKGRYADAIAVYDKAAMHAKKNPTEWIRAQNGLAFSKLASGAIADAASHAEQALSRAENEWGLASIPALDSLDTLGLVRLSASRFGEARAAIEGVLKTRESLYGPDHLKVAESYLHAAMCHAAVREYEEAIKLGDHGLKVQQRIFGGQNARAALALISMATIYAEAGRTEEARQCYQNGIPVLEETLGLQAPIVRRVREKYLQVSQR